MDANRLRRLRDWMIGGRLTVAADRAERQCVLCGMWGVIGHDLAPPTIPADADSLDGVERVMGFEDRSGIRLADDVDDHCPEADTAVPICGACIVTCADVLEWEGPE